MPIEVQWGAPASPGLAGLAQALIRERISAADRTAKRQTAAGGGFGRDIGKEQELARYQAELAGQQSAQQWQQQQQEMQYQQELERQNFDYEYTQKQKHEWARLNNAEQMVMSDETLTDAEKHDAVRRIHLARAGIKPSAMPKDPNAVEYPEGQGIGQTWTEQDGSERTRNPDGKEVVLLTFEETKEGMLLKQQMEREKEVSRGRTQIVSAGIEEAIGATGKVKKRPPKESEIQERLELMFPWMKEERLQKEAAAQAAKEEEARMAREAEAAKPWWERKALQTLKGPGKAVHRLKVEEVDKQYPEHIGYMMAIRRTIKGAYGDPSKIPAELREQWSYANAVLRAYRQQGEGA